MIQIEELPVGLMHTVLVVLVGGTDAAPIVRVHSLGLRGPGGLVGLADVAHHYSRVVRPVAVLGTVLGCTDLGDHPDYFANHLAKINKIKY